MVWTSEASTSARLTERSFELNGDNGKVPGVYWTPADSAGKALVLLGHGGGTHKRIDYIVGVAQLLAERGIASMAIDGPGHGERAPQDPGDSEFESIWNSGGGHAGMLSDWRAALDFLDAEAGSRPTGWWGLSMGTMMGLPVCASDDRIQVAQLGLMGTWGPNGEQLRELAPMLTCPTRFLVQWDDEVVPRDTCLELFGLIGAKKKTLHGNPGAHAAVPRFEIAGSADYLARNLLG